jgi:hypothetical protein
LVPILPSSYKIFKKAFSYVFHVFNIWYSLFELKQAQRRIQ